MKSVLIALAVFALIQAVCAFTCVKPEEAKPDAVFVVATVETDASPIPSDSGEALATEEPERFYAELG